MYSTRWVLEIMGGGQGKEGNILESIWFSNHYAIHRKHYKIILNVNCNGKINLKTKKEKKNTV